MDNLDTHIKPTWCPGCGNFGIWASLKQAIVKSGLPQNNIVVVYDIGCSGNMSSFINVNCFHGLHGRAIPAAGGIKLANPNLKVIVIAGDGGLLGEGLSHFIHSARNNTNITVILHNNQTYSLTTGQSSPTALQGTKGKATPLGVTAKPLNPVALAILSGATFVARTFGPQIPDSVSTFTKAIFHTGFSFIDALQPCVTYNKLNTVAWYKQRLKVLSALPADDFEAMKQSVWTDETIYQGIFKQTS